MFRNMRQTTGTRPEQSDRFLETVENIFLVNTCCEAPEPGVVEDNVLTASSHVSGTQSQVDSGNSEKIDVNVSLLFCPCGEPQKYPSWNSK